jgi:hypothetical protein
VRQLSNWIEAYLLHTSEQETPESVHQMVSWLMISTTFQRKVWMERVNYKIFPNLYAIVVAQSAKVRKSVGMQFGVNILQAALPDVHVVSGRMTAEGLSSVMVRRTAGDNNGMPHRAAAAVLIYADELASLFGHDVQQASRMATFLTDIYSCRDRYEHITKGTGTTVVTNSYPVLLAATAPDNLRVIPQAAAGGLHGRILYIVVDHRRRNVAWANKDPVWRAKQAEVRQKLIHDLGEISEIHGEYQPTQAAEQYFADWYDRHSARDWPNQNWAAFAERCHDTLLKLAMIHAAAESDALVIELRHVLKATAIIEEQFPHIGKAFAWMGTTEHEQRRIRFLTEIARAHGTMPQRPLMRAMGLPAPEFMVLIESLEKSGYIECGGREGKDIVWRLRKEAYDLLVEPRMPDDNH